MGRLEKGKAFKGEVQRLRRAVIAVEGGVNLRPKWLKRVSWRLRIAVFKHCG